MTKLSVIIPVYRSEELVGTMVERTLAVFDARGLDGELILVNDASPDASWSVLESWAARDSRVRAIDLARNEGQHQALMVGARFATGEWVATLDDDLQNPPECLLDLLATGEQGADLVFGRFRRKEHAGPRRLASRVVTLLCRVLYGLPSGLVVCNVRLMKQELIHDVLRLERARNYFTGLAIYCAKRPANVLIDHAPRPGGESSYSLLQLGRLFWHVLSGHPRLAWLRPVVRPSTERIKRIVNEERRPVS